MTSPPAGSFLDFFILEANDYVEQLDALLLRAAGGRPPEAEALQRVARALRGSATMAKLGSLAELASAVEVVGRALKQGTLAWDAALKGVLTGAIDDLKILVRAARTWSEAEEQRAAQRTAEIGGLVKLPGGAPTPTAVSGTVFFTTEASNIAAGLELLATRPDDRANGANVLARVRALRGVAGVRDIAALAEVLEAAESGVRPFELGEAKLSPEHVNLLRASAELLRTIAGGLSKRDAVTSSTPQYKSFLAALDGVVAHAGAARVVPIADLFYKDAGPHIVSAAGSPPMTPAQRFRMEVVSLGEHLHRVIAEARSATDAIQQEHARAELGRALRSIRTTAASFGQSAVAQTVEAHLERTGDLTADALNSISTFAASISPAPPPPPPAVFGSVPLRDTHQRVAVAAIGTAGPLPSFPAPPAIQPTAHARVFEAVEAPEPPALAALDATIASFETLASERLAEPVVIDDAVPMDTIVYRGRAALDRAIEVRNAIRKAGGAPAQELLEELYDLVELARVG